MKGKYAALYALILLSLVVTGIFLAFMPDEVPMHYNFAGEMDRMGSKYENLLFPIATALMGVFFILLAKNCGKKKETSNEKVLLWTGIGILILFNTMFAYFLWKDVTYLPAASETVLLNDGIYTILIMTAGCLFILIGNIMPKTRLNSIVGLRTVWSMKNDRVWQKSQRFGGISFVICGFAVILTGIFVGGLAGVIAMLSLLIITAVICVAASYIIYKKDSGNT